MRVFACTLVAALGSACIGPIGGNAVRPDDLAPASDGSATGCPDLSGTYQVEPSMYWWSDSMGTFGGARNSATQVRPFTLFFTGLDQTVSFDRVTVAGPASSRRLRLTFEGSTTGPRELLLEEGVDYRCGRGTVRFKRGPRVASREDAAIELYRGADGALIEQTTIEEPGVWLLVVPLWAFKWSGEWNRYDPAGGAP